jgi:alcohol dehydrogenase (NADP+)
MGAKHFILSNTPGWEEQYKYSLDTIISTSDAAQNFPIKEYLSLLKVNGEFITYVLLSLGLQHRN